MRLDDPAANVHLQQYPQNSPPRDALSGPVSNYPVASPHNLNLLSRDWISSVTEDHVSAPRSKFPAFKYVLIRTRRLFPFLKFLSFVVSDVCSRGSMISLPLDRLLPHRVSLSHQSRVESRCTAASFGSLENGLNFLALRPYFALTPVLVPLSRRRSKFQEFLLEVGPIQTLHSYGDDRPARTVLRRYARLFASGRTARTTTKSRCSCRADLFAGGVDQASWSELTRSTTTTTKVPGSLFGKNSDGSSNVWSVGAQDEDESPELAIRIRGYFGELFNGMPVEKG